MSKLLEMPLVSIVIPCFNAERYIAQTLSSAIHQNYRPFEILIVDDGSSDNSVSIIKQKIDEHPDVKITLIRQLFNQGPAAARNVGIESSSGKYIAFLDSDDIWKPNKLATQIGFMESESLDVSFTSYEVISSAGKLLSFVDLNTPRQINYNQLLKKRATFGCSTVAIRADFIGSKRFPSLPRAQDYAFWLDLLRDGGIAVRVDGLLTQYRINPDGISRNKIKKVAAQWRVYKERENIFVIKAAYLMFFYAWNAVFRR